MCKKNSQLIVAGLALIAISLLFLIFVLADSQYIIQGQVGSENLRMDYGVTHFCWKVRLEEYCVKWTDPVIEGTGESVFRTRCIITTLSFSFCCISAFLLLLLGGLYCCNLVDLKRSKGFAALIAITVIMLIFSLITPLVPTIEYAIESGKYKDSRQESFYFKSVKEIALVNYYNFTNEIILIDTSGSDQLTMVVGYALFLPYVAVVLVIIALILFICAGKKTRDKDEEDKKDSEKNIEKNSRKSETSENRKGPNKETIPARNGVPTIYGTNDTRSKRSSSKSSEYRTATASSNPFLIAASSDYSEAPGSEKPSGESEKPSGESGKPRSERYEERSSSTNAAEDERVSEQPEASERSEKESFVSASEGEASNRRTRSNRSARVR